MTGDIERFHEVMEAGLERMKEGLGKVHSYTVEEKEGLEKVRLYTVEELERIINTVMPHRRADLSDGEFDDWLYRLGFLPISWETQASLETSRSSLRRQLEKLGKGAGTLKQSLSELHPFAESRLNRGGAELGALDAALSHLSELARSELEEGIAESQHGPRVPFSRTLHIAQVQVLWEEATGQFGGYTYDPYRKIYTGPFLEFAAAVSQPLMGPAYNPRDFVEFVKRTKAANRAN